MPALQSLRTRTPRIVSHGCRIHGRVSSSVLGPDVVVDEGIEVIDSVVLGSSRISADVRRSIVDEGTDAVEEASGGDEPAVVA